MAHRGITSCRAAETMETLTSNTVFGTSPHAADCVAQESPPMAGMVCPPDKLDAGIDILPSRDQAVTFSVGQQFQGQVRLSGRHDSSQTDDSPVKGFLPVGQLLRPKSPTQQCSIPEGDRCHFGSALMESKVGSEASERIFHLQQHELICAILSPTTFVDSEGCVVSSIDINYYWCNFCTFSTATKSLLLQHVMEHRFHCRFCRYQSFSRADIIHHSFHCHSDFKETAANTRFCTLLCDYLRIQHPKERKRGSQRKRKHPSGSEGDCGEQLQNKLRKTYNHSRKQRTQERYSPNYICFDVGLEDKEERRSMEEAGEERRPKEMGTGSRNPPSLEEVREVETPPSLDGSPCSVKSRHSDSALQFTRSDSASKSTNQSAFHSLPLVPANNQHPTQTSRESVFPPDLVPEALPSSSFQLPVSGPNSCNSSLSGDSRSSTPSPPNLSTISPRSVRKGSLEWVCGYCPYTCASNSGIKKHCKRQHRGKPFMCISPCELDQGSAPPLLRFDGGKLSSAAVDQMKSSEEIPFCETITVTEQETTENCPSDEPPVLVKQMPTDVDLSDSGRVDTPVLPVPTENIFDLKCYHCDYISQFQGELQNHIVINHKGKSLNGVDGKENIVFLCSKASCTFTSSSGLSFLNHIQECIPSPTQDEGFECLQATIRLAEHDGVPSSSRTGHCTEAKEEYSCIYCKNQFVSNKNETKQHVLDVHESKCLVVRNVYAHRKRRKSHVYFCRWCFWEGEQKFDHDMHGVYCPHQSNPAVRFSDQANQQVSRIPCGVQGAQTEVSTAGCENDEKDGCMKPAEKHQGEGTDAGDVCLKPPVTSTAESCSQAPNAVNSESSILLKGHDAQCSSVADNQTTVCDGLQEPVDKALSFPDRSSANDNGTSADEVKSNEDFDRTFSPAEAAHNPSDMCQTPPSLFTVVVGKDASKHLSAQNINTADSGVPLADLSLDAGSPDPLHFDPFQTTTLSVDTNSDTSEESKVLQDFNAVISREISDNNNSAKDSPNPPVISLDAVLSDVSSSENKVYFDPSDLSLSDASMPMVSASGDIPGLEIEPIVSPMHLIPVDSPLEITVSTTDAPSDNAAENIVHSSHTFPAVKAEQNNISSTLSVNDCAVSKDAIYEKRAKENSPTSYADPADGSVEPPGQPQSLLPELEKQTLSLGQDHEKNKSQGCKRKTSKPKKLKNVWPDGREVKCFKCDFLCESLVSIKSHTLEKHCEMVSVPFRSPFHKNRHYKCNFFACPSLQCKIYDYSESAVVTHYRRCHTSQPHPYTDSTYVPAPVKCRRRNNGKNKQLSKPPTQTTSHPAKIHIKSSEKMYMCLYCEQKTYTDTVSEMKTHHFSNHAGQPITIRDVVAHKEKRTSRFFVCDQRRCDFCTYELTTLDKHMETQHKERQQALADRSYQCLNCGWITSEDASVQDHVSSMHENEGGATVVTLAHGDEQQAVEERYIECGSKAEGIQDD